jgi:type I restriction enzyme S subunit
MKNWQRKKIKEVVPDLHQGLNTAGYKIKFYDEGYPIIQTRNLENGIIDLDEKMKFMSKQDWETYKDKYKPKVGDVFLTNIGTIGKTAVVTEEKDYLIHWNIFIFKLDKNILDPFYLKSFLDTPFCFDYYKSFQKGGTVNFITKKMIENLEIPLPPLPEQQRIVSILDEAFAAIAKAKANAEQNLKNAKELFESYLQGVFENGDWEKKKLQDVAKVFGRGKSKHRPRNWEGLYGGNYPFIQTGEVRNANKYISSFTQTYNEVGLAQSKLWKKGTICITIAANIAETAILDFDACIPDSIIGFEVDEKKADLNFAYYLLQYFKAELQKLGKGSAQDNINLGTFENQYFPFPTVKEQENIVCQLDALRAETQKLEGVYQKKIADLEELKKSILQKAFAGELKTEKLETVN